MAAQGYFFTQAVGPTACSAPNQAGGGAGGPADAFGMLAPTTGAICTPSGGTPPPQPQTPADVAVDVTGGGAGTGANVDTGGGSRGGGGVGIDDSYGGGGGGGGITPTTKKPWWPWAVGAAVVAAVGAYVVKAY